MALYIQVDRKSYRTTKGKLQLARASLPLLGVAEDEGTDDSGGDADTTEDGDTHEALLGDLIVDELAQAGGLEVGGFLVKEKVVVAAGLAVVAELVAPQGEVVKALAAALGGESEDFGQETDAELLVVALCRLDEAPGVVELGLDTGHLALLFELGAEDIEL
jgi:hypothetical protein